MRVVVLDVDGQDSLEVAAADDKEPVETFAGSARISVYLTGSSDGVVTIAA